MNAIEFNNVSKKFRKGEKFNSLRDSIPKMVQGLFKKNVKDDNLEDREFWALKDVDIHVAKGEVVGVIGPNGAGKSTILKLLSRIMNPTKGSMKINGRLSALIEVTAGFHPELTGRENVYLNGTILGMKRKEIDQKFDDILEFSGLGDFIDTPVKRYSSGMFSRLGFSVAAHVNPDILLVDEVLAVGDISFQAKCAEKMRELLRSGTTIMLVSHNLVLVQSLCRRIILLDKGQIIKEGAAHEVIPFYENSISQQKEDELRKKIKNNDSKVRIQVESPVIFKNVEFSDGPKGETKDIFFVKDALSIKMHFLAKKAIPYPIFSVEIVRADGVACCGSDSRKSEKVIEQIEGEGEVSVDFGHLCLAPGIYMVKVAIWDKDVLHPLVIRKEDIFRITIDEEHTGSGSVFIPPIQWRC